MYCLGCTPCPNMGPPELGHSGASNFDAPIFHGAYTINQTKKCRIFDSTLCVEWCIGCIVWLVGYGVLAVWAQVGSARFQSGTKKWCTPNTTPPHAQEYDLSAPTLRSTPKHSNNEGFAAKKLQSITDSYPYQHIDIHTSTSAWLPPTPT